MRLSVLAATVVILSLLVPRTGLSQERWPVSVELGLGFGTGSSSGVHKSNEKGYTGDVLVAVQLREVGQGSLVAASGIAMQGAGPTNDDCVVRPDGGCAEGFPELALASALLGWETSSTAFRVVAGPGYVVSGSGALAVQARADAFLHLVGRLGIGLSGRGVLIPAYEGESLRIFSAQVGLRVR